MDKQSTTRIYGLIGYPVKHSFSPVMHNAAFKELNIPAEYRLFEIKPEKLEDFLRKNIEVQDTEGQTLFSQGIAGFNITIPHKVRTYEILLSEKGLYGFVEDIITEEDHYVSLSGAINTVKRDKDKSEYRNTDAKGFMKSLKEDLKFNTEGKNVFIFGCGGAGRAVVAGLTWEDTKINKIYIYDISREAYESAEKQFSRFGFVKDKLEFISLEQIPNIIKDCHLLVNASPVGMKAGDGSIIDRNLLRNRQDLSVYDVVYNRETQLIKDAKSLKLPAVDGLGMLLYQGVDAFELWTGKKAPVEIMRKALMEALYK